MAIVTLGIDLAKNVFALHGVGPTGKPELVRPEIRRSRLLELVASLPPCLIGMETCSGAHHWAREFEKLGHTVRLMAPKFVAPYRMAGKRGKNDANDAAAICEAVTRPNMRFVPIKTIDQQAELFVHRARQGYIEERTALINRLRGLLSELGIALPLKASLMRRDIHSVLEDLPGWCNVVVGDMLVHLADLDERIATFDRHLAKIAKQNDRARLLMKLAGVGPTTASAIVASIGNGHDFKNSRQFCAWLGLTPGQHSSGGKARLGSITKAGDAYLRTLLVMGARSLLMKAANHTDSVSRWAIKLKERRGFGRAVVAIAAKNARMCWAALRLGESFRLPT
ncbi:IS110 family RNA-guided transposase [Paraburkholderia kururiensis]|jgi:transposase|uniref:IS110 family transposase n=1 Tax=Paraburkholderia kururiensis TaxID=984307 RepID=UPI0005AA45B4|nr:IS110 family transposase [Paraburkholderia kururiensis]